MPSIYRCLEEVNSPNVGILMQRMHRIEEMPKRTLTKWMMVSTNNKNVHKFGVHVITNK